MNLSTRCLPRRSLTVLAALLTVSFAVLGVTSSAPAQVKNPKKTPDVVADKLPLTHRDYDIWNTIQNPLISANGMYVAYTVVSGDGDSELVVRDLGKGKDLRHSRGRFAAKGGGAENKMAFTADSARVVFTIAPPKADPAKKGDKAAVKPSLGIMDLADGKVTVIENVRTFLLPEENPTYVLYQRLPPGVAVTEAKGGAPDDDDDDIIDDITDDFMLQVKGKGGQKKGGGDGKQAVTPARTPSELVLHTFGFAGNEAVLPGISEFQLLRDGIVLICSVTGKDATDSGVFAFAIGTALDELGKFATPAKAANKVLGTFPVTTGKAKYSRFTWDEGQRFMAFFADWSGSEKPGPLSLMAWDRGDRKAKNIELLPAVEVLNSNMNVGLKEGCVLTDRGNMNFSDDGSKLFFSVAPPSVPVDKDKIKAAAGKDDKAVVELWHYRDDFIQPMQKARGNQDKNRTYAAVLHLKTKKVVQLADSKLPTVNVSRDGNFVIGANDVPYRPLVAYDATYSDIYVVKTSDGTHGKTPLLTKHHFGITFSPSGRYAIFYDGKDWNCVTPSGKPVNITKKLPTKFYNEDHDSPSPPPAYGICGWSNDEHFVYLYDKYDIWELSPLGTSERCLTRYRGRKSGMQFRYAKLDPKEKGIDLSKPMLLRAESFLTRETGFFALSPQSNMDPIILALGSRSVSMPTKAKNANVLLLTSQSFYDYPDLHVASLDFKDALQISDVNPQKNKFNWGKSHLVTYKNADGVPLQGMLITPENFDPSKKYPMIVYIYERLSQNLHHFVLPKEGTSINPTYYASNGYLVFMPDIVYTVGYPGQSALKCVLPGIQTIVDRGFVDENAIGIQGHSWGGYQIAYMITQTGRFKAAAAGAPVSNMTSAYDGIRWGTGMPRQFQYEKTQSRIGGSLWEFPMRFVENSPVFMADRVKTPLMMLHNDQDDAVPWYQGIEYYLALRRLGKEVYMFNYPGEKHGLTKKANKLDYTIRMQQFFDHQLRGAPAPEWMVRGIPYTPRPALKGEPAGGGGD